MADYLKIFYLVGFFAALPGLTGGCSASYRTDPDFLLGEIEHWNAVKKLAKKRRDAAKTGECLKDLFPEKIETAGLWFKSSARVSVGKNQKGQTVYETQWEACNTGHKPQTPSPATPSLSLPK